MKVTFISTYPPTKCGVGEHARHLVKSLEKTGIKPEVIAIKNPDSINPFYFLKLAKKASKKDSEEDIIHLQFHISIFGRLFGVLPGFFMPLMLIYFRLFSKSKILITLHDVPKKSDSEKVGRKGKILFYYYKLIYFFLRNFTDMLITHSEYGRKIILDEWKIKEKKVISLPLGLPTNIKKLNQIACKKKLGYLGKKILLLLGFIRRSQNHEMVLKTLKELDEKVILLIAGKVQLKKDQAAYENLLKKIEELQLKDRIKLFGFVKDEDLPLVLNATDIGITLHVQGGGDFLSSTMAMQLAYQIPTLSTNIPSFENLKKNKKCIETFKEDDSVDLTKKIKSLLNNPSKIKYLKEHSKNYWNENNWNEIGKRTKNLYLSLFKKNSINNDKKV